MKDMKEKFKIKARKNRPDKWPVTISGMELRKEEDFIIKTDRFKVF